ncbi:hypothetical protein RRG08_042582 [Elysia crispata]|uniref:Uncharacterized protein n=1 Tax=Elysia crispata TaxID=231223 RepID=A0AAE1CKB0_9GAST|nr:hypothetical protein RRG08_042582 [Elysia crispata]
MTAAIITMTVEGYGIIYLLLILAPCQDCNKWCRPCLTGVTSTSMLHWTRLPYTPSGLTGLNQDLLLCLHHFPRLAHAHKFSLKPC